jgi:hypothetical protein
VLTRAPTRFPAAKERPSADTNDEARSITAKELAQPVSRKLRAVTKEFVNRFAELGRFIRQSSPPVDVDGESKPRRRWHLLGPIDAEFLGGRIQVSLAER